MADTNRSSNTVTISHRLAIRLHRLLERYSLEDTYTHRERTGGVLQGCPRGPRITPAQLACIVRVVRDAWREEVKL